MDEQDEIWDNPYNPYGNVRNRFMQTWGAGGNPPVFGGNAGGGNAVPAASPSKLGYGISAGAGVAGATVGAILAQRALNARRRGGVLDIRPDSLKSQLGEYALRAKSSQLPNYTQALNNIQSTQTQAAGDAQLSATSPAQLQAMIAKNARYGNQAKMGLATAGADFQQRNLATQRGLMNQSANYQERARNEYNTDVSNLRNAVWSNINNAVNTAGQAALMIA